MSEKYLTFGHQNPDTDAITAAMSFAYLQTQQGLDVEAVALGEPNDETVFVLNHFDAKAPRVIKTAANEVNSVMLVDHNEFQQSVSDIEDVQVASVVDHHRIANFHTDAPLYYYARPVGCTNTIIYELFVQKGIDIPKQLAGLMVSAIISDTLLLKSPTTTEEDKVAANALAKIAGINMDEYGIQMLKAGTNLAAKTDKQLIDQDAKSYELGGKNIRIDQVNTVDLDEVIARQDGLMSAMESESKEEGYDLFFLLATDILTSNSVAIVYGEPKSVVEKAFNVTITNDRADLPGVVSRKKQVVPQLTEAFK